MSPLTVRASACAQGGRLNVEGGGETTVERVCCSILYLVFKLGPDREHSMPTSTELLETTSQLTEALSRKMPPEMRKDLASLRLASELRLALRKKVPELDKA
jgi:hypothetical protein